MKNLQGNSFKTWVLSVLILNHKGITGFFTSLVSSTKENDNSGEIGVSSLIDTWIVVRELEDNSGKRRVRGLYIVKSRGTKHSSDVHKLILSDDGIALLIMDDDAPASPSQEKKGGKSITEKPKLIKKI